MGVIITDTITTRDGTELTNTYASIARNYIKIERSLTDINKYSMYYEVFFYKNKH